MNGEKKSPASVRAALGQTVLVSTNVPMGGQKEHAAIITRVWGDDLVNVLVLPAVGDPYSIASIYHVRHSAAGSLNWRYPPRV